MTWKNISLGILFIAFIVGGRILFKDLMKGPTVASFQESDWKTRDYEGITMDSPFELVKEEEDFLIAMYPLAGEAFTYYYETRPITFMLNKTTLNPSFPADIDETAEILALTIEQVEGVTDFTYSVIPIRKHNSDGRRLIGSFNMEGDDSEIVADFFIINSRMIQIIAINLMNEENQLIRDRIMNSLKIVI
jgi:hypothetical protein